MDPITVDHIRTATQDQALQAETQTLIAWATYLRTCYPYGTRGREIDALEKTIDMRLGRVRAQESFDL